MSIYSTNRLSFKEATEEKPAENPEVDTEEIVTNEAYGENDFGRILYEIEMNDMAFFKAMVYHDISEGNALKEGTLLEAEIEASNNEAKKSFFKKMAENFKSLIAKIKGIIKNVIRNIETSIADNKALISKYKKLIDSGIIKDGTVEMTSYRPLDTKNTVGNIQIKCWDGEITELADVFEEILGKEYRANNVKEFTSVVLKNNSTKETFHFTDKQVLLLGEMLPKNLKKIRDTGDLLESMAKDDIKWFESKANDPESAISKEDIPKMRASFSKLQTAYTLITKCQIMLCKNMIRTIHSVMQHAIKSASSNATSEPSVAEEDLKQTKRDTQESINNRHAKAAQDIKSAVNNINTNLSQAEKTQDETDKLLDQINSDLDDLLNSF